MILCEATDGTRYGLSEWQAESDNDCDSIVADPQITIADNGIRILSDDSHAYAMGFGNMTK